MPSKPPPPSRQCLICYQAYRTHDPGRYCRACQVVTARLAEVHAGGPGDPRVEKTLTLFAELASREEPLHWPHPEEEAPMPEEDRFQPRIYRPDRPYGDLLYPSEIAEIARTREWLGRVYPRLFREDLVDDVPEDDRPRAA